MKKVLILTTISGFLTQFEMNDVQILKEMGYEIHYATNFRHPVYDIDQDKLLEEGIRLYPIDIEKSPIHIVRNIRAFRQLCRIIREENISLIHCHNPIGGVLGRMVALACGRKKLKVIYTAHGFHFYKGAPFLSWLIYYPVEALLASITDCLITINREDYECAKHFPFSKRRLTIQIPGVGVKTERFSKDCKSRDEMRSRLKIRTDDFYILSVGEINRNKNHEVILKAIAMLQDSRIHYGICGKGEQDAELLKLAEKLGISEQFTLFGFRNDIPDMLQCADCFAFPSKREGLGIAAIEAMAGGIPLITSDCRGTREYMVNGFTGFICFQNSPSEYAKAIKRLMTDQKLRRQISFVCREMAAQFDLSETDKIMRKVYAKMTVKDLS